jgi:hypothetical protein
VSTGILMHRHMAIRLKLLIIKELRVLLSLNHIRDTERSTKPPFFLTCSQHNYLPI